MQDKLRELSRRSQGKGQDEDPGRVLTAMKGKFALRHGALSLPDLTFQVPGAAVNLAGKYQIDGEVIDFRGTLKMQASVSQAVGGFKSIFLKPFDGCSGKKARAPSSDQDHRDAQGAETGDQNGESVQVRRN